MERQLVLLETPVDWRLDERTREIGRRGVASARAALRSTRTDGDDPDDGQHRGRPSRNHRSAA
jgi:hypothetical protein